MPYVSVSAKGETIYFHKPVITAEELAQEFALGTAAGYEVRRIFEVTTDDELWRLYEIIGRELYRVHVALERQAILDQTVSVPKSAIIECGANDVGTIKLLLSRYERRNPYQPPVPRPVKSA